MSDLLERLKQSIDNGELDKYFREMIKNEQHRERWINIFHNRSIEEQRRWIELIIKTEKLDWLLFLYAANYGKEHVGITCFTTECYLMDNGYIIEQLNGQGTCYQIYKAEEYDERKRSYNELAKKFLEY